MTVRALITGITGMDGSILAELLLERGFEVHGLVRRQANRDFSNIAGIRDRLKLHSGDLADQTSIDSAVKDSAPDYVFNLAAQSHVGESFHQPVFTGEVTGLGAVRVFEAVRRFADQARVYQASSSELFGRADAPQNEDTPMNPVSPYGISKLYAFHAARTYRSAYHLFISNGILFNHEHPRRGPEFVTRRITLGLAGIAARRGGRLQLGDPNPRRDWGWAPDYCDLMLRMLEAREPLDLVGATGETHTVREFADTACGLLNLDPSVVDWGTNRQLRPTEIGELRGDASRANTVLGWTPTVRFPELVRRMVASDFARISGRPPLLGAGRPV